MKSFAATFPRAFLLALTLVLPLALSMSADRGLAGEVESAYSKIRLEACAVASPPSEEGTDGGSWICPGYQDIPVRVAEGDLRMFVSFGPQAGDEIAAVQTFPNFNTINETLEWRLRGGVPFATILRWFLDAPDGGRPDEVLVVTQLGAGVTCHVAYVDARANGNANALARQAADDLAGSHDCNQMPRVIGRPGVLAR
ncbi:hypothetical protein [Roseibium aestuarii]|uniref:Uncharacterized protein n=1 Tax=Roseibium aestuarii TaxID=2600299 RepID=A0ABW4JZN4_9HYPH|nr:hypothetical protein [Roseibium aestuarii]